MKPAENVKRFFKNAVVRTRSAPDEAVLENIRTAYKRSIENRSTQPKPIIGRFIMKNPKTKPAIAVIIIVLIGAVILSLWQDTGSGVALANVLARIEQVKAYMYQTSLMIDTESLSGEPMNFRNRSTTWISRDYGLKTVTETIDPNTGAVINTEEKYVLPQERASIDLFHNDKQYTRTELDESRTEEIQKELKDPRSFIKEMLDNEYVRLGEAVVDGIRVEGFQVSLPDYLVGTGESVQTDIQLWVDVETRLPVKAEMGATYRDIPGRLLFVVDQYQWDIALDAVQFKPVIPADYTQRQTRKPLPQNEETVLQGLKLISDTAGHFPKSTAFLDLASEFGEFSRSDENLKDLEGLSKEEVKQRGKALLQSFLGFGGFFNKLIKEKKEPIYYGHIVTPENSDQVLMRWKVSDNEYRVIFGDLHAETVTAEVLKELEKELPSNDKNY